MLLDLALRAYGGAAHVPGEGGHDAGGRWVTCHRCLDFVDELCIEAIKRGLRAAGRARAPLGEGVEEGVAWLRSAGRGYIKTALASVDQTLRAHDGRLANPGATALINKAYQEAFAQGASSAMRCTAEDAHVLLAAIFEQVHRGWRIPEGQLVDWEKALAYVSSHTGDGCSLDRDGLRRRWEDDVRPAIERHPRAAAQLDRHLYRLPEVQASGRIVELAGPSTPASDASADLLWWAAATLLRSWSDDPEQQRSRARTVVAARLDDALGGLSDVDPALLDQAAECSLDLAEEAVGRAQWAAAVQLAIGPRVSSKMLVSAASAALETAVCALLSAPPGAVGRSARTTTWRGWVDVVIVDACHLHVDVHTVRDDARRRGATSIDTVEASAALIRVMKRRHGWTAEEAAHHAAQSWFALLLKVITTLPLARIEG